ncbi:MAG: 30S ribosome-binding factor RbfA [Clostridium sp.]|nr:30S ribosome-binding factor RbfA [Clostridium sp.]
MRKNSVKNTRVSSEVTRELSSIIRDLKDPRISPMASVVSAQVTPDLKFCKVYVSVLGSEEELKDTILGLKSASGFIRNQLAKNINLRNTPELYFVGDTSIEYGVRMTKMISDVAEYDREHSVPYPEETEEAAEEDED